MSVKRVKGENFYHAGNKLKRLKMAREGAPQRNSKGQIVRDAVFNKRTPAERTVHIDPNRKWFGNTRTITLETMEKFRHQVEKGQSDPYSVLLRSGKLPMSLLTETKRHKPNLLDMESFNDTFGKKATRTRPKLDTCSLEEYALKAMLSKKTCSEPAPEPVSTFRDEVFRKGQSKRIWNELYKVIDSSDVIVHVLDARDPLGTQCKSVEKSVRKTGSHKHLVYLLNKCDLVPASVADKWVKVLSKEAPVVAFRASIENPFGKGVLINLLRQYAKLHPERKQISVGFVGYPNTGKSSIINALKKKKVCVTAPIPGQTKVWQYVTLMKRIYLIDCPGVVPYSPDIGDTELVLKGAIRIENIKDPENHVSPILARAKACHLERMYGVTGWQNETEFMILLAKKKGRLLKGGEPDIPTVAKMVLNDWVRGEIPFYTNPPKQASSEQCRAV